jgi:hypothetical protein
MTCSGDFLLIMRYVDNELDRIEREYLSTHLNICRTCQHQRDELIELSWLIKQSRRTHRIPDNLRNWSARFELYSESKI